MAKRSGIRPAETLVEECALPADGTETAPVHTVAPEDAAGSPCCEQSEPAQEWVTIRVPLGPRRTDGYSPKLVYSRLGRAQGSILARLTEGLNGVHARLTRGSHVEVKAHAVAWLLDEIGRAAAATAGDDAEDGTHGEA